jgi:deaminated glutathione amidase
MMNFNAAIIQTNTPNNPQDGFEHLANLVRAAALSGANFIATPEGSNFLERDADKFNQICPLYNQETIAPFSELAKECNVSLLIGSALFKTEGQKAVNRSLFFNSSGKLLASYDKIHLFDVNLGGGMELMESRTYEAGEQAVLVDDELAKFGLSICYDVRFAHLYRLLCQNGAQIITIPAAFTVPTGVAHWEILLRARAIENGAYVIAPAQVGQHDDGRKTYGHSMIINPWGEIIAHIEDDATGFAIANINLEEVRLARKKIPAWQLNKKFELK